MKMMKWEKIRRKEVSRKMGWGGGGVMWQATMTVTVIGLCHNREGMTYVGVWRLLTVSSSLLSLSSPSLQCNLFFSFPLFFFCSSRPLISSPLHSLSIFFSFFSRASPSCFLSPYAFHSLPFTLLFLLDSYCLLHFFLSPLFAFPSPFHFLSCSLLSSPLLPFPFFLSFLHSSPFLSSRLLSSSLILSPRFLPLREG